MGPKGFLILINGIVQTILIDSREKAEEMAANLSNKYDEPAIVVEVISEFKPREINEVVDSYESTLKYLGRKDEATITGLNVYNKAVTSLVKLMTIADAWNKADNFIPDFDNKNQNRWYPYFYKDNNSLLTCNNSYDEPSFSDEINFGIGSYICFKTETRAKQFGMQFISLWNDLLLFK